MISFTGSVTIIGVVCSLVFRLVPFSNMLVVIEVIPEFLLFVCIITVEVYVFPSFSVEIMLDVLCVEVIYVAGTFVDVSVTVVNIPAFSVENVVSLFFSVVISSLHSPVISIVDNIVEL